MTADEVLRVDREAMNLFGGDWRCPEFLEEYADLRQRYEGAERRGALPEVIVILLAAKYSAKPAAKKPEPKKSKVA